MKNNTTVCIIQARMNSTRLPGKVLMPLAGTPVLSIVYDRVKAARRVNEAVIATSSKKSDDAIVDFCKENGMKYFRGSENDVLDRVIQAGITFMAHTVVDITADCPLVDPQHIDRVVEGIGRADYASNIVKREWPDGLDVQAYRLQALKAVAKLKNVVREHVGWNILQHPEVFKIRHVCRPPKWHCKPEWGLTLDTKEDHALLHRLFMIMQAHGKGILFPVEDVLQLLINEPGLLKINSMVQRKIPGMGDKI